MCFGDVAASGESSFSDQLLFMRQRLHRLALASFLSETQLWPHRKWRKLRTRRLSARRDTTVPLNVLHFIPQRHEPIQWKDLRTWFAFYCDLHHFFISTRKRYTERTEYVAFCCAALHAGCTTRGLTCNGKKIHSICCVARRWLHPHIISIIELWGFPSILQCPHIARSTSSAATNNFSSCSSSAK